MDSDSEASTTSSASPSEQDSPAASGHIPPPPPTLERLIQHFVAAKQSLNSTNYVWRANELVTNSRTLVEEIALLNARNTFARRGVDEQIDTLHAIHDGITKAADDAGDEFGSTIEKLDLANERLERTLAGLKKTIVDVSLQKAAGAKDNEQEQDIQSEAGGSASRSDATESEQAQTLYDFIDPSTHETLQADLRSLIDSYNEAHGDLETTIHTFSSSIKTITDTISDRDLDSDNPADKRTLYDEPPPTIPHLFRSTEDHAAEMATLLQSLVSHYDLCVTALKHTEGGGEAAKKAIQLADGLTVTKNEGVEESLYLKTRADPISDEERTEMLRVLENDAGEVEDVVGEIRERNSEQESHFGQLSRHARQARSIDKRLREVLEYLHEMHDLHLPAHLSSLQHFRATWSGIRTALTSKTASLLELAASNEGFLSAYAELLKEIERRKAAERQIRKVAEKARREIERLEAGEEERRKGFVEEWGGYLPSDLWGGDD